MEKDNLDELKKRINNSMYVFNKFKDDTNLERYDGLKSACDLILKMIEDIKKERKRNGTAR